jgi:acyl carrier protein
MDTTQVVFRFFEQRTGIPGASRREQLDCHYLDVGLVDSMQIVELVMELEGTFGIRFEAEDLQSDDFQTVGGLIGLVDRLRGALPA